MNKILFTNINNLKSFNSLQYLRIFSTISIIIFHIEGGISSKYWITEDNISLFSWGNQCVHFFFCLSGFIISYSSFVRPKNFLTFLYSRIVRIYPAYLITGLLVMIYLILIPDKSTNFGEFVSHLFFDFGRGDGYVYVGWTLFYEMCFYICFSSIVNKFHTLAKNNFFLSFISVLLIISYLIKTTAITDFLIGIDIFLMQVNYESKFKTTHFRIILLIFVSGIFFEPITFFIGFILLLLINIENIFPSFFKSRIILFLADSSYSIYLVQVLTISFSLKMCKFIDINSFNNYYFYYFIALTSALSSTIIFGTIMRRYVEKPFSNFFINKKYETLQKK